MCRKCVKPKRHHTFYSFRLFICEEYTQVRELLYRTVTIENKFTANVFFSMPKSLLPDVTDGLETMRLCLSVALKFEKFCLEQ